MSDFCAKQLHDLVTATHTLQRLYYHKEKWSKLFPLVSLLAEQYDNAYIANPRALQAQLMFYISKQGFTTNLVINQTILCCILCHCLSVPNAIRQALIACCLVHLICAQKESNQLANNESLTPQGKKLWAQRHLLAIKLMQTGHVKEPILYRVLSFLPRIHKHLAGQITDNVLDQLTCIVALAEILAKKITLSKSVTAISLNDAIKSVYTTTHNGYLQYLLKKLTNVLPPILPASCYQQNQQLYLYIDTVDDNKSLSFALSEQKLTAKGHWQENKTPPTQTKFTQKACLDEHLIYSLWFKPLEKRLASPQKNTSKTKQEQEHSLEDLLIILEPFRYISLEQLLKNCQQYPNITPLLCQYASVRTGQKINDLKHAMLLLGPARVPDIIKKIALLQMVLSLNLPNQSFFETRLYVAMELLEQLANAHHHLFAEQASCTLLKYVLSVFQSYPHLFINTGSEQSLLKGTAQLNPCSFLLLPAIPKNIKITKDVYLTQNWYKAINDLSQLEHIEEQILSVELSCLLIAFASINRFYFNDVEPCTFSNNMLMRAFRTLNITECTPSTAFHIFFSHKYNLHPFNSL